MESLKTTYVSIGNSDNKLTQAQWSQFVDDVAWEVAASAERMHGEWFSLPHSRYQNAAFCFDVHPDDIERLKMCLRKLAFHHHQDSIAWAEAETEFLPPWWEGAEE